MASNYDPTFANVVTGQSSTAATQSPPRRSPLDELFDDPDYAAADVEERRAVLRHVAQSDPDYAQATQEEQRAFEEFAVTKIPLQKRAADAQRNAPLAAELYQPNVLKEGAAAVDAVVKPAMEPVVAPFREQWYEPMKERATQGVEMLKQGLGSDPGPQIAPDVLPPFANRALKTGLGALTAASAVTVPFENAAGQLGQLAGFTEEGALPAIRGLGGLAGGAAISGALPGGVMRRVAEETIGIGQIEGPGADISKAMDAARPGFEPLDATMQRVSAMESAERARDMMAARAAARQNRQAAGVVVRPEGDIVLPPQGAPAGAAGVLRREAGDVPLGPRGEELPVEGDVYIGPQHAPQAPARPATIDSEAVPPAVVAGPGVLRRPEGDVPLAGAQGPAGGVMRRPEGDVALPQPPDPEAATRAFVEREGGDARRLETIRPDDAYMERVAKDYDRLQSRPDSPKVQRTYRAFADAVRRQYQFMTEELGIAVEYTPQDPYKNSKEMFEDVAQNRRLRVYSGGDPHPALTTDENNMFRAVHDFFGHYRNMHQFGSTGEFNATLAHSQMFPKAAQPALFTETLGQNAWVNYGPRSKRAGMAASIKDQPFATQKAGLLNSRLVDEALGMRRAKVETPTGRPIGMALPDSTRLAAEAAHDRPEWLQNAIAKAQAEIAESVEYLRTHRGAGVDAKLGARDASNLAIVGAGVLWDMGGKGYKVFRRTMRELHPDVPVDSWKDIYIKAQILLAKAELGINEAEFQQLVDEGRALDGHLWYEKGMADVRRAVREMPDIVEGVEPEDVHMGMQGAYSPRVQVSRSVEDQLTGFQDAIRGDRVTTTLVPKLPAEGLRGGKWSGDPRKVDPYVKNLQSAIRGGAPDEVPIDTIMARMFGKTEKFSELERGVMTQGVKARARRIGEAAGRTQAASWVGYQHRVGNLTSAAPFSETFLKALEARGGVQGMQKLAATKGVWDDMVGKFDDPEIGGFSYDFVERRFMEPGEKLYIVSMYPERQAVLKPGERLTRDRLRRYANANRDLLDRFAKADDTPLPKHVLGAWRDSKTGKTYLDVSAATPNREAAVEAGRLYDQIAVFDLEKMEEIPTGGTGEGVTQFGEAGPILKRAEELGLGNAEYMRDAAEGRGRDALRRVMRGTRATVRRIEQQLKRARDASAQRLYEKHAAPGRASLRGSGSIYDTEDLRDLAVIGAYELLEKGKNIEAWRQAMLKQYPDLAPKLDEVLQGSKSYLGRIGAKQVAQLERSARPGAAASPAASIPPAKGMRPSPDAERVPIPVPTKLATKSLNEDVMRTIANRWQEQGGVWDEAAKKQYNQVSDKIAADIADGVVDLRDMVDTLRDSGVSLEDFGRYVFKGSASEAGHKLNTLARVSRELDRLATDDEVLERALKDLNGVEEMLRDLDGIC
jgi:hypothetical protein